MSESEKLVENLMIKQTNNNKIENIIEKSADLDKKKHEKEMSSKLSESKEEEEDEDSRHNSEDYNENENKRMVLRNKKKMNYWKDDGEDDDDEDFWKEEDDSQYVTKRRTRQSGNNTVVKQEKYPKKQRYNQMDNDSIMNISHSKKQNVRTKRFNKKSGFDEELLPKKRKRSSSRYSDTHNSEYDEKEAAASLVSLADTLLGLGYYNPLEFNSSAHLYPQYLFPNTNNNTTNTNNIKNDKKTETSQKTIPPFTSLQLNSYPTYGYNPNDIQYGHLVDISKLNNLKWKRCATHVKIAHLINLKRNMSLLEPFISMEKIGNMNHSIPQGSTNFLGKFTLPNNIKESII